nr:folate-binding protein YgfZ [Pseudomonas sp. NW5]
MSALFCLLDHEGVLAVHGAEAAKFLQGQLTCNLNYLDATTSSLGARCTPKGRMLSSFRIVPLADGFALAMDRALAEPLRAELQKYAAFFRTTRLVDASSDWVRFGLLDGDTALSALGIDLPPAAGSVCPYGAGLAVRLHGGHSELWSPAGEAAALETRLSTLLSRGSLNDWQLAQIRAGVGQVVEATRELFIPQMLNLQSLGGVSFKKGCYTGQEIVARMQYLGRLKRRLYRLQLEGDTVPAPATELFSPVHGSSIGEVVLAARSAEGVELLAVLQDNAVEDGRLHLGSLEGPTLQLLELPYTIDADRDIQH